MASISPKLYLLRLGNTRLFKIGVSTRPVTRLAQIANERHPVEIVAVWPGLAGMERDLHRRFAHVRVRGEDLPESGCTEWFRLSHEDVQVIRTECALARMRLECRK
jgi:hypothetical protein